MGDYVNIKKSSEKILKYGCLPIIILVFLMIIVIFSSGDDNNTGDDTASFDAKKEVNTFCLSTIDELTRNYGDPDNISEFKDDKDYTWILDKDKDIRVMVFMDKGKNMPTVIRFFNVVLGHDFWKELGWDKNMLENNHVGKYSIIKNLNGIEEAMYKYNSHILNVKLESNRNKEKFGSK